MIGKQRTLLFLTAAAIILILSFAGCGDDGSTTFISPTGATGATGEDAGTATLIVRLWEDEARTVPFSNTFKVNLERTLTVPSSSITAEDDTSTPGTAQFDNITPGNYDVIIYPLGYKSITQKDVDVQEDEDTKAITELDIVLEEENKVIYGTDSFIFGSLQLYTSTTDPSSYGPVGLGTYFGEVFYIDGAGLFKGQFYTVGKDTGDATVINDDMGVQVMGMDFSEEGILYAVGADITYNITALAHPGEGFSEEIDYTLSLYTIDYITGVPTKVTDLSASSSSPDFLPKEDVFNDITFGENGVLYGFLAKEGEDNDTLAKIDISTGKITLLERPGDLVDGNRLFSNSICYNGENLFYLFGLGNYMFSTPSNSALYTWQSPEGTSPSLSAVNSSVGPEYYFGGMDYSEDTFYTFLYDSSDYEEKSLNDYFCKLALISTSGNVTLIGNVKNNDNFIPPHLHSIAVP